MWKLAVVVLALGAMPFEPAMAQVAADPAVVVAGAPVVVSTGTWAGEILTWVASAFAVSLGTIGTAALWKVFKIAGIQVTDQMKAQLQGIIVNGLNHGAANLADKLKGQGQIQVKNAIVADAVAYTQDHAAETMKALGLDPTSGAAVEAIKARIETALNDPTSPTPPIITPPEGSQTPLVVLKPAAA